jgi:hypothetical protein
MTVEQIVEIPANRRIALEVPRTVPIGKTILSFTPVSASQTTDISAGTTAEALQIEDIRRLLQKEMTEKGTLAVIAANGDGWEAHVMEHYAES